jgi:hypothetical protein
MAPEWICGLGAMVSLSIRGRHATEWSGFHSITFFAAVLHPEKFCSFIREVIGQKIDHQQGDQQ